MHRGRHLISGAISCSSLPPIASVSLTILHLLLLQEVPHRPEEESRDGPGELLPEPTAPPRLLQSAPPFVSPLFASSYLVSCLPLLSGTPDQHDGYLPSRVYSDI